MLNLLTIHAFGLVTDIAIVPMQVILIFLTLAVIIHIATPKLKRIPWLRKFYAKVTLRTLLVETHAVITRTNVKAMGEIGKVP